ncbi:MAG TPA: hypothetical protein VJA26_17210, partial [Gammaproteobacteria bacterium]|nr:hypothetical protein [Gammaproteobacteria bacterium]
IRVRAGQIEEAQVSLLAPLVDMMVFAPFFGAAVYYRRKPEWHKRLMIVATTALLIAAVGRMPFLGTPRNLMLLQLIWISPILLAMGYDFLKRRIVHPIYVLGIVVFALESPRMRGLGRETDAWRNISGWFATWVN